MKIRDIIILVFSIFFYQAPVQSLVSENFHISSYQRSASDGKQYTAKLISPAIVRNEGRLPVIYLLLDENGMFSKFHSEEHQIESNIFPTGPTMVVNSGSGSTTLNYSSSDDFEISINGLAKSISVRQSWPIKVYEGEISESELWDDSFIRHVRNDLLIGHGATIEIEAGCIILVDENINIEVQGQLVVHGTAESPVLFTNESSDAAWGGIRLDNPVSKSTFSHTIFTGGGGNKDFAFGHSDSQPVLFSHESDVEIDNCYFIYNVGKGIGSVRSMVLITNSVFNRCDMGAEFHWCSVEIDHSHFSEMSGKDGVPDDDNDCLYFYHYLTTLPNLTSKVSNSVFCLGDDDAIDHNEAKLIVENCFINGFKNEGIAASAGNFVNVINCLIMNCGQGIEAGYGEPEVWVDHCVVLNCDIGIRFGDSYNWGSSGQMCINNSILYNNVDNVWNFDLLTQDSVANAIMVSYSITNDEHYDQYPNCFSAVPIFLPDFYLNTESPGVHQGSDGCDIGLYRCNTINDEIEEIASEFSVFPNPNRGLLKITSPLLLDHEIIARFFGLNGLLCFTKTFPPGTEILEIELDNIFVVSQPFFISIKAGDKQPYWYKIVYIK